MEFSFTEEQRAVADLATSLFREHGSDEHVRKLAQDHVKLDAALWTQLQETGLLNLTLPSDLSGSGMGMQEAALVLQQQGRHLAAAPLWSHQLATLALAVHGQPALRERVLAGMVSGQEIATLATELHAHAGLHAQQSAQGWLLNGRLEAVVLEDFHAHLLLAAQTTQGSRLFVVSCTRPGMQRTQGALTDHQTVCDLSFNNVLLPGDSLLAIDAMAWLEPRMACCLAALQLGVVEEALHRAAAYVGERHQFGRPLGSFQALAVRAADSYIEVELLRSALWQLAWRIDQGLPATAAGRVAKYQCAQAGYIVGHTAIHFHGGVGADLQYPVHRFYLKSQALSLMGGGAQEQLARIGHELADGAFEEYQYE